MKNNKILQDKIQKIKIYNYIAFMATYSKFNKVLSQVSMTVAL